MAPSSKYTPAPTTHPLQAGIQAVNTDGLPVLPPAGFALLRQHIPPAECEANYRQIHANIQVTAAI